MTGPYVIRHAAAEDCDQILDCLRESFAPYRVSYSEGAFLDTVLTKDSIRSRMDTMTIWVAADAALHVVGTVAHAVVGPGEGHIRGMAVRPECQGSGVSRLLLDAVESELRQAGCKVMSLDTTQPLQRAMRFYVNNGFRPSGKVGSFFGMELFAYEKRL